MLAYHYLMSDNNQKAFQYLKLSGNKASSKYANQEAYNYYKESFNVLGKLPENSENKKLMLDLALLIIKPIVLIGFPEEAKDIVHHSEILAKELGDKSSSELFYSWIMGYYILRGNIVEAIKYVEPRLLEARKNMALESIAAFATPLIIAYNRHGQSLKIMETLPSIITMIEKNNKQNETFGTPQNLYSWFCSFNGAARAFIGSFEKSREYLDKGLNFAKKVDNIINLATSEFCYSSYYISVRLKVK